MLLLAISNGGVGGFTPRSIAGDNYGKMINEIRPGAGFTDTENFTGAGKTIPQSTSNGVVSDIVMRESVFVTILELWNSQEEWDAVHQQALYVPCHEFGHVKDNALRCDLSDTSIRKGVHFRSAPVRRTTHQSSSLNSQHVSMQPMQFHQTCLHTRPSKLLTL